MLYDVLEQWDGGGREGMCMYIHRTDSLRLRAETNPTV